MSKIKKVTIFTPTFNRINLLKKLGESLMNQTNSNFTWLVVDDGSNDGTQKWLSKFKDSVNFEIKYIYQENSGKHVAFNNAIQKCDTEYMDVVDSDDILSKNAIQTIYDLIKNLDDNLIGIICPKKIGESYDYKKWDKINNQAIDIMDSKEIYKINETNIIFKMSILKKYSFPIFYSDDGKPEKFLPEGALYNQLKIDGKFKVANKCFYYAEYQEDGLTKKLFTNTWVKNFNGVIANMSLKFNSCNYNKIVNLKIKAKIIINVNALCLKVNKKIMDYTPSRLLSIVLYIPSYIYYIIRFK